MKIYTKTGDDGTTGLFNGQRVSKNALRVNVYGTVDELNSIIGIITTLPDLPPKLKTAMNIINNLLFNLGSDLATPLNPTPKFEVPRIKNENIIWLESLIDKYDTELQPLRNFILPGGTMSSAFLQNARTVCRRAERLAVELSGEEFLGDYAIKFLNRLSDYLFTAARYANHLNYVNDVLWESNIELTVE